MFNDMEVISTLTQPVSEFLYRKEHSINNPVHIIKKLSSKECKEIVQNLTHKMIRDSLKNGDRIVVGVSGGGDSNALLYGLTTFKDFDIEIIPVMIKGIPEWDKAVPKAQKLCSSYNLKLRFVLDPLKMATS